MSPRNSKKKASRGAGAPATLDVYVGLLALSVGALALCILMLWFQVNAYL